MNKPVDDLVRVAHAGGGFRIDAAGHIPDDLVRVAHAATQHHCRIDIINAANLSTNDLVRIGAAGEGSVFYD